MGQNILKFAYQERIWVMYIIFSIPIIISFIIDLWLIADKLRESKYKR